MKTMSDLKHASLAVIVLGLLAILLAPSPGLAQFQNRFMSAGSLHSWFSAIGCEIEVGGPVGNQQDGMQWPAIYAYQDMQAARGLWIGAVNFTDERGQAYPHKVVHVGPRVNGANEFFPLQFKMISRFAPPEVYVDGELSYDKPVDNDEVDPTMAADRMLVAVVNSQLGITMTRKIMQFSQDYHDNYFIYDYTFTNTGNTDGDADIELPNTTLEGVYFYFQYRNSVCAATRYVIGNATGWGINAMNDARGDGLKPDPPGENFRAQFTWHGKYPAFTLYDNIGGPIWNPGSGVGTTEADTTGRLGATQFIGVVTLHADRSATDKTDDPAQPSTTSTEGSDEPLQSNNDAFNIPKMTLEYGWMSKGHQPRHADRVEPSGNFIEQTGDPALGTPGGFSIANGYGPYTLRPGESIRIVMAEGAAGLSRERQETIGRQYKRGQITAREKNTWVMSGRDSLFQMFRRALANFTSGYAIPRPPLPPKSVNVESGGDRIVVSWETYEGSDPNLAGFEIYRAAGSKDSTHVLIHTAGPGDRSYADTSPIRGRDYYYYVVSVGKPENNTGGGLTPSGALRSSRYYTQTYNQANLKRQAGPPVTSGDVNEAGAIRVVPNPFHISAPRGTLRFDQPNQIKFFNIPGQCTIRIFTESGELIQTIEHTDGSGDEEWNSITSSNQVIVSGLYLAVVTDKATGKSSVVKFVVVR